MTTDGAGQLLQDVSDETHCDVFDRKDMSCSGKSYHIDDTKIHSDTF